MRPAIIGTIGILILIGFVGVYLRDMFNADPLFMGETGFVTAYVTKNDLSPIGKSVTHKIEFKYNVENKVYRDHYFTNNKMSQIDVGDSLRLEYSLSDPSKCIIDGYYAD